MAAEPRPLPGFHGGTAGFPDAGIEERLAGLFRSAPTVPVDSSQRIVVFSDLHLGDGGPRDDFLPNGDMVVQILRRLYLRQGYSLLGTGIPERLPGTAYYRVVLRQERLENIFARIRLLAGKETET